MLQAELFSHDLTIRFGVLASECRDEEEYIVKAENSVAEIQKPYAEDLIDLFSGNVFQMDDLHKSLITIIGNPEKVEKISLDK